MSVYNDSFMDTVTNPVDIIIGISTAMSDAYLIGNLLLLGFFIIFIVINYRNDFNKTLIIGSLLTSILSMLFYGASIISAATIIFPVIIFFISIIIFFMT